MSSSTGAQDLCDDLEQKMHLLMNRLAEAFRTGPQYSEMVPEHLHNDFVRGMHQEVDRFCEDLRTRHQDSIPLDEPADQEAPGRRLQVEDNVVSTEDVQTGAPEPPSKRTEEDQHQPTTQSQAPAQSLPTSEFQPSTETQAPGQSEPPARSQPLAQSLPRTEYQPPAQSESPAQSLPTTRPQPPAHSQLPTDSRLAARRVEGLRRRQLSGFSGMRACLQWAMMQATADWARENLPVLEEEFLEALWSAFSLEED